MRIGMCDGNNDRVIRDCVTGISNPASEGDERCENNRCLNRD